MQAIARWIPAGHGGSGLLALNLGLIYSIYSCINLANVQYPELGLPHKSTPEHISSTNYAYVLDSVRGHLRFPLLSIGRLTAMRHKSSVRYRPDCGVPHQRVWTTAGPTSLRQNQESALQILDSFFRG